MDATVIRRAIAAQEKAATETNLLTVKPPERGCLEALGRFVYDKDTGAYFGRTPKVSFP